MKSTKLNSLDTAVLVHGKRLTFLLLLPIVCMLTPVTLSLTAAFASLIIGDMLVMKLSVLMSYLSAAKSMVFESA
jgi:hypothetical protein